MLSKFRLELGINAVNKMTQMFKDVSLSKVLRKDYYVHKDCEPEVQLESIKVLTQGNWPFTDESFG
jgi:hypothetical protein